MLEQLVPMIGVVLGSLATYAGATMAERARFKRLLSTRWDENKLDAYAEFASCVKDMLRAAQRHSQAREEQWAELPLVRSELEAADNRRSTVFERVVLLGDPAVKEAAAAANQVVLESKRMSVEGTSTPGQHDLGGGQVVDALNLLHEAAREDLGIRRPARHGIAIRPTQ
ncbi:hypothetical protein [Nocardia vulneris]|uniref:hypothetical protein n=1 Tax=Nocardia vulneris TaxID=1141657 RepID=UPI0007C84591|nr:hypothetical protein [Nocardia vulneris]